MDEDPEIKWNLLASYFVVVPLGVVGAIYGLATGRSLFSRSAFSASSLASSTLGSKAPSRSAAAFCR